MKKMPGIALALLLTSASWASPGGAAPVLLRDPVLTRGLERSYADVLASWWRGGPRGSRLILFASREGILDPASGPPDIPEIRRLLERDATRELAERSLPFPLRGRLFTPQSWVGVAIGLGLVKEVVWVAPRLRPISEAAFRELAAEYARHAADVGASLRYEDGLVRGYVGGAALTVCTPADLARLPRGESAVVLDAEFFSALYQNPVRKGLLALVGEIAEDAARAAIPTTFFRAAASFYGGGAPLYHRLATDAFLAMVSRPSLLAEPVDERWMRLGEAVRIEYLGDRDHALGLVREVARADDGYAYPYFLLAAFSFQRKEYPEAVSLLASAAARDQDYLAGFAEFSVLAGKGGDRAVARRFLEEGLSLAPSDPTLRYMLGNTALFEGRCEEARGHYQALADDGASYPELEEAVSRCRTGSAPGNAGPGR